MSYAQLIMGDGTPVLIEVDRIPQKEAPSIPPIPFNKVMELIQQTVKDVHKGYVDIPDKIKPKTFDVSFGIAISGEASVIFSTIGVQGSFTVTMSWGEG